MKTMTDAEHRRVLLLNPGSRHAGFNVGRVHMGLSLMARILEDRGHLVKIVDYSFLQSTGRPMPAVEEVVREFRPDVVGVSVFTFLYREAQEMIVAVAQATQAPIVLGGPHITMFPDDFRRDSRVSYIVQGEAETAIVDLMTSAVRQVSPVMVVPDRPLPAEIPAANLDVVCGKEDLTEYQIQFSRGCPYACSFCNICIMAGRKPRARDIDVCIDELARMKRLYPKVVSIAITDDCPTFDRERFNEFLERLGNANLRCKLTIDNVRAKDINEEFIRLYKRAGGQNLCVGVESGNPDVFGLVHKGETLDDIVRGATLVRKSGLALGLCFVIGLPEDNLQRHRDSIALARSLHPDYVFWNMCVPWPGTEIMAWFEKHGQVGEVRNFSTLIDPNISYGRPPAVSAEFPERDRVKAWLMSNMETYEFPLTITNVRVLNIKANEFGLRRPFYRFLLGKLPHHVRVRGGQIARILRHMGLGFLLLLLCRTFAARLWRLFPKIGVRSKHGAGLL